MMFDYTPKLPELIFYPLVAVEVAHGIALALPTEYQAFCVAAVAVNCALLPVFYVWKESCKYVDGMSGGDTKPQAQQTAPVKQYLDMNKADAAGNVFAQTTDKLKVNAVMAFNKTLIEQYQGGLDVNLTEAFWLNKQPGADESRWIKAGGVGRADFVEFIERGILWKAYKKVGGQGKRVPDNWRKIAQLAQGYPLPTFDKLPKQ